MMVKDLIKFQDEIQKHNDVKYMSKVEIECAKAKIELMSYKIESYKSMSSYSYQICELNKKIYDLNKELVAHQDTISNMSKEKEAQKQLYKTRKDKELEKLSQEQVKHEKVWKQNESTSFRELNDKFFEIEDFKAQIQDKDIAMSELKKLVAKLKGKSVATKFEKPSVIRQQMPLKVKGNQF
ncbi:hypothetical protein Tco_0436209 [Tanacetum coccineum]